jgi:hypothetical protein
MHSPQFTAPVAACHADGWLQHIHARAVDQLKNAEQRQELLHCRLALIDVAGWPSLELVAPLTEPSHHTLGAYRAALSGVLGQASNAMVVGAVADPPDPADGLTTLWSRVLRRLNSSPARLALWRARLVAIRADGAWVEVESAAWLRAMERHREQLEDALALELGQRVPVRLIAVDQGEG